MYALAVYSIFWLAFSYRARGGALSLGPNKTMLARILFWGIPVGLVCTGIAAAHHFPLWLGAVCGVLAVGGACIGHSSEQTNTAKAYLQMGIITTIMLALIVLPFAFFEPRFLGIIPLGMLGTFASWLGYKMKIGFYLFGIQWCVPGDSSWEEFFIGMFAFGFPLVILLIAP